MNTEITTETLAAAEKAKSEAWDDNYEMMQLCDTIMFVRLALERLAPPTSVGCALQDELDAGLWACWEKAGLLSVEYSQAWHVARAAVAALEEQAKK